MPTKIIHLISGPRNLSTALMYAFAQRKDTNVVDEPYYAAYLDKYDVNHPSRNEILSTMEKDFNQVTKQISDQNSRSVYFVKNMAHHLLDRDTSFLDQWNNVFLIRNPHQLIASFAQVIPNPTMQDIGLEHEYELFSQMKEAGKSPIVLDSAEVLKDPKAVLSKLCERLGIEFDDNMLHWKEGGIPEDGIWAKHWYKNVHNSTGFAKQSTSSRPLPEHCEELYQKAKPYYEEMSKYTITA